VRGSNEEVRRRNEDSDPPLSFMEPHSNGHGNRILFHASLATTPSD
jgi:hypothetical protein